MQLDICHVIFSEESKKGMASIRKKMLGYTASKEKQAM